MKKQINEVKRMQQLAGLINENEEFQGNYKIYEPTTFRKSSGYREEVDQIKNLIKKTYPEYINNDIGKTMDADMELVSLAYKVYGINVSVDDIYAIINNEDLSELPEELIQVKNKIEELTGEPILALRQAMKELNIVTEDLNDELTNEPKVPTPSSILKKIVAKYLKPEAVNKVTNTYESIIGFLSAYTKHRSRNVYPEIVKALIEKKSVDPTEILNKYREINLDLLGNRMYKQSDSAIKILRDLDNI